MATLAFAAAGAAVGSAVLPSGISLLGATVSGGAIGSRIGAIAGSFVDSALFGASGQSRSVEGPRLSDLRVTGSSEGAPIPRLYGRARLGGQVIWASDFEEVVETETSGDGKGGGLSGGAAKTTQTRYTYFANFAVAICEGEIRGIARVWADGQELDLSQITYRLHRGSENQAPDSLIAALVGSASAPAYRGTAYIVFERLPLEPFGNRLPQLSFEVMRAVDRLSEAVRAVVLIPGTGEFSLATTPVARVDDAGLRTPENVHTLNAPTDLEASLDQLDIALPNVENVSLAVSWFATDLRAGHCRIRPGVDSTTKQTEGHDWSVSGLRRTQAHQISTIEGRAAYGGTPSDAATIEAIQELKARGKAVTLLPFILMDVPAGNALSSPYAPADSQPQYPWRGRITIDPAPGVTGSPDQTSAATSQIAALVGQAAVEDFSIQNGAVVYTGPDEWSLRRFVLHQANLAKAAGGVDTFVIGTELRGLTQVRSNAAHYPFVTALIDLAADVRAIVGSGTKITYAADWSEYFGHQPADGSGDVYFHLDPLWASPNIDAIGIDLYWPLSDWRSVDGHLDSAAASSVYEIDYLKSNIRGGEYFDWYYASQEDRIAQIRTPITDGAGKPWVFRAKDLTSWWSSPHYDRPGGVEAVTPTAWQPMSKPVWFMELGCPALDNGANQPNVFYDPKSSESFLPHFSAGRRDDTMQRRYIQGMIEAFDPGHPDALPGLNPVSPVYGGHMVDTKRMYIYAWDARPYPAFPFDTETWSDGDNWQYGHWLNGRMSSMPLEDVVAQILADNGFELPSAIELAGIVPGLVLERIMSAREALQPLELAYFFDSLETGGAVAFRHRGAARTELELTPGDVVEDTPGGDLLRLTRGQETDLPRTAKLTYIAASGDYRSQVAEARRLTSASQRVARAEVPLMLETQQASQIAENWLFETWAARDRAAFSLPPSLLHVEPGDVLTLNDNGLRTTVRVVEIADGGARAIEAHALDSGVYERSNTAGRPVEAEVNATVGPPTAAFLDLPILRGDEPESAAYIAFSQSPWPGTVVLDRWPTGAGFYRQLSVSVPATLGRTISDLPSGPLWRIDHANACDVVLMNGTIVSVDLETMLAGANAAAIEAAPGVWEVLQFQKAELTAPKTYRISEFLRGQAGTEADMTAAIAAGARFVLLNASVARLDLPPADLARDFHWRYGPAGKSVVSPAFKTDVHSFSGIGRRPLAPVQVRSARTPSGIELKWIRRTRIGGDSWEQPDVPLSETSEAYQIDVFDGPNLVRTLSASQPTVTYTADQIAEDFGGTAPPLTCVVYQVSETWGRGAPAQADI